MSFNVKKNFTGQQTFIKCKDLKNGNQLDIHHVDLCHNNWKLSKFKFDITCTIKGKYMSMSKTYVFIPIFINKVHVHNKESLIFSFFYSNIVNEKFLV